MRLSIIFKVTGYILRFFGLMFLWPMAVAVYYQEWSDLGGFALAGVLTAAIGQAMWLSHPERELELRRIEALAVVAGTWLVVALLGSVPYLWVGLSPVDAVFESMSGFTTFVAHSGGPPLQIYLLRQKLDKTVYAGTVTAFFAMGNILKIGPYMWLGLGEPHTLWIAAALSPAVPVGVMLGRRWHDRIEEQRLYLICYAMLLLAGLKLLYDGVSGFLH